LADTATLALHTESFSRMPRRQLLLGALLPSLSWIDTAAAQPGVTDANHNELIQRPLQFPRDLGSHPQTAIEWWYVTGELRAGARSFGFQLTFFRSRVPTTQTMRSAFAARQLIFAHAALTDLQSQRLVHDQRIARSSGLAGVDLAASSAADTDVWLRDWSLRRDDARYLVQVRSASFGFTLSLQLSQPLLLQGDQGWSRKGPEPTQASFYYSVPQLQVRGELRLAGQTLPVTGRAWLDHEWSESFMHPDAVGWDWIGMNLDDGSALTAFRLRNRQGQTLWAGGSWRSADAGRTRVLAPDDLRFQPGRLWHSAHSGSSYPVQWFISLRRPERPGNMGGSAWQKLQVLALLDNQELDSRNSTGAIYWEGLSELRDEQDQPLGRGYLEMTGYASPLRL
jgi:predicted secreted hydrolase